MSLKGNDHTYPHKHAASSFPVIEELTVAIAADTTSLTNNYPVAKEITAYHSVYLFDLS